MTTSAARRVEPRERRSAERERLADVIAELAKAQRALAANTRGISNADRALYQRADALERAEAAIEKARSRDTESAAAAAKRGAATAPASTLAKARAAQVAAQDALDLARRARDKLQAAERGLASGVAFAQMAVEQTVDQVIASVFDVKRLVKETEQLTLQLARKRCLLGKLAGFAGQSPVDPMITDEALRERAKAVAYAKVDDAAHSGSAEAAWRALREKLAADADAVVDL